MIPDYLVLPIIMLAGLITIAAIGLWFEHSVRRNHDDRDPICQFWWDRGRPTKAVTCRICNPHTPLNRSVTDQEGPAS